MPYHHIPAMPREVAYYLNCQPGKIYVDCTLGGCGHARGICEKMIPGGMLIGIDQDADAIQNAEVALKDYLQHVHLFHGNFAQTADFLSQLNIDAVDGMLLDLGLSFHQIAQSGRGFSFKADEPLDMRMDVRSDTTAAELLHQLDEADLADLFFRYGEERHSRAIARKIVEIRKRQTISTSRQLAEIVSGAVPPFARYKQKIHPATRVFMALRIAVNHEIERLEEFLKQAADLLNPGGRLCVLSFHSLEDRMVKQHMRELQSRCTCPSDFPRCVCNKVPRARMLTSKAVRPTENEIQQNPMARSTRLRAMEKL
ncbi:MAG: 16S rRNA (cytosine(1402)-N(4))-methyltransferase RsmH [Deltaproteobacteria bacterium]|nr:16S rRNA (cytosine(1402)-N(4))-methyltransferase RsmH [Deltaproteobacteria bacterium]